MATRTMSDAGSDPMTGAELGMGMTEADHKADGAASAANSKRI